MNNPVQIDPENLQRLFKENAVLRILVEDLLSPEMYGHKVKAELPDLFERVVQLRGRWK
jgi:hypothetical protein